MTPLSLRLSVGAAGQRGGGEQPNVKQKIHIWVLVSISISITITVIS